MDTTLKFGGGLDADLELSSFSLAGMLPGGERTMFLAGGGVLLDGALNVGGTSDHNFDSGGLAFAGFEHRVGDPAGGKPSIDLSLRAGFTWGRTSGPGAEQADYRAIDLRGGVKAGWTVAARLFPYAAGRVFGGPVSWELEGEEVTGSDAHHYQLAVGAGLAFGPVVMFAEFAGLGEKAISAGLGSNW